MITRKALVIRLVLGLGTLAALPFVAPSTAQACGDVFVPEIDHRIQGVANAEKMVREGKYVAAAQSILRMFPEIRSIDPGKDGLLARAQRTLALAMARADGGLDVGGGGFTKGKTEAQRRENMTWSARAMERVQKQRPNDPAVETDLAEVLAKVDGKHEEARKKLQSLAERDLMSSPQGYATLARLQQEAGDAKASEEALKRCQAMARDAATCQIPAAPTGGQS